MSSRSSWTMALVRLSSYLLHQFVAHPSVLLSPRRPKHQASALSLVPSAHANIGHGVTPIRTMNEISPLFVDLRLAYLLH